LPVRGFGAQILYLHISTFMSQHLKTLVARNPSHTPSLQIKTLKPTHATLGFKAYTLDPRIQNPKLASQILKPKSCKLIMDDDDDDDGDDDDDDDGDDDDGFFQDLVCTRP